MSKSRAANKKQLSRDIYKLTFKTDECNFTRPGQYALITIGDICRPYMVCDYDSNRFTILFSLNGRGGKELSELEYGEEIESVTGLGNGFDIDNIPDGALLVADSMGITEMLELSRTLLTRGKSFKIYLGYNSSDEIFMIDSFRNICNEIEVLTLDGSNGREGRPCDVVRNADYVCASGTPGMLRDLAAKCSNGQFSLSDLMMRTSSSGGDFEVETFEGMKSCAAEGPVFDKNGVNWDTLSVDRWNRLTY